MMSLETKFLSKREGGWVPVGNETSNFTDLSELQQTEVIEQIDNIIKQRFSFISYNGITRKHVEEMTEGGRNPFDNQCIVIDEVHNFISKIVNGRQIGQALYKLLLSAKNCKLVCLSGTPIINYPHEIAFLVNLLTGIRKTYNLKATIKASKFPVDDIKKHVATSPYVDYFGIDENAKQVSVVLVPDGFKIVNKEEHYVARDEDNLNHSQMLDNIIKTLKDKVGVEVAKPTRSGTTEDKAMPEDQEDFNRYFINFRTNKVANPKLFMKRIIGAVSFYSTYSPELYPSVTKAEVALPMNDFQFPIYEEARAKEHKKESQSRNKVNNADNPFASTGQVYRFYSRAICNFVFPEEIKRPFPSKMSFSKAEVDITEDDADQFDDMASASASSKTASKSKRASDKDEYLAALNEALAQLSVNMHQKSSYLNENNIGKYSPKFKAIYDKVKTLKGNALVYSQFKKVEGLGVLGLVLKANGYSEFKVKKTAAGDWDIDIPKEDYHKPKFTMFTGNNEESKILLKIFNSNFDTLPETIKVKLPLLMAKSTDDSKTPSNLHGGLIKVIMITQSGAEGISLKNVRQVHIVEPYWNHVRMDQVVGRAVRTCSHVALPPHERNVEVFTYYTVFTPELLEKSFTLRTKDKGLTTDEYIYTIAKRKATIISSIMDLMKRSSVDCGVNAKKHKNMKCFNFPTNMDDSAIVFNNNIRDDMLDYQYEEDIVDVEWKGKLLKTQLGNFIVNEETNIIYDYDLYVDSGKLVKLGLLKQEKGKYQIVKLSAVKQLTAPTTSTSTSRPKTTARKSSSSAKSKKSSK
jgi:superfamily II DNA or RNA helicase